MSVQPAAAPKRRARRIAADEAHAWARNLRLGNSLAKLTLSMLTIYVDGDGMAFVGIDQLAEDTELSPDTVRKRLAWLEHIGAVARFPQWIDEAGNRNSDGRGKRTTDKIRLLIDADPDDIEARANGAAPTVSDAECNIVSPSHQQGLNPDCNNVSPRLAPDQPSDSSEGLISEPEQEILPQSPIKPEREAKESPKEASQGTITPAIERFEKNYPIPLDDVPTCRTLLAALTPGDREDAIVGALGYRVFVFEQKRKAWNATKFLRLRKWLGYVALGQTRMPKPPAPRYFVPKESTEYQGLLVAYAISGLSPPRVIASAPHACEGVYLDVQPNAALASLAKVSGVPVDTPIVENTKRWHAWRERMAECHMRMAPSQKLRTIGQELRDQEKRVIKVPTVIRGARFPSCWPPPKGESRASAAA